MSNLFSTIRASATTLEALQRSSSASENNVANASTPGYAKQRVLLKSTSFDPAQGLEGGVHAGPLISSRDQFVETSVQHQATKLGEAQETSVQLAFIDSTFSLTDSTGISPNLDKLFTAFSAWTVAPLNTASKENVLTAAADVAESFNKTADSIDLAAQNSENRIGTSLTRIADIAERIRRHNVDVRDGGANDAGLNASVHADLEELSSIVDAKTVWQTDGTATVLIGGGTPLVIGDRKFGMTLEAVGPSAPVRIMDVSGADVTRSFGKGKVAALLEFRNETVPSFRGDLNRLAKSFADRVNTLVTAGDTAGVPLFLDTTTARTLKVNSAVTASTLSAADPAAGGTSNARALALADLARPTAAEDMVDGISYVSFTGKIASNAGRIAAEASRAADSHKQLLAQARIMRDSVSGVSLDEEAINLMIFQRAYQATSRMVSVLDEITKMAVNMGRN